MTNTRGDEDLTLDIGCGSAPRGAVNVDARVLNGVDVVCSALYLPFAKASFSRVFLSHVIEHFTYTDASRLLQEARRVLTESGKLDIWTPNFQSLSLLKAWLFGAPKQAEMVYPPISGGQDYKENVHLSHWTTGLLRRYVGREGFNNVVVRGEGDYNGVLSLLRFITLVAPSRGGVIHLTADTGVKE